MNPVEGWDETRWTFLDPWEAFGDSSRQSGQQMHGRHCVGELTCGRNDIREDGSTIGSFGFVFHDWGSQQGTELRVFGDGAHILLLSGVLPAFACLPEDEQNQADIEAMLLRLGFVDTTAEWKL